MLILISSLQPAGALASAFFMDIGALLPQGSDSFPYHIPTGSLYAGCGAVVSELCTQGHGGRSGPGEVLTATVINAVGQAGAGYSRGGEHFGDSAGLSCTLCLQLAG